MKTLKDGYGLGLFQYSFNNIISYGHTGAIDGFSSIFKYFPNGHNLFSALIDLNKTLAIPASPGFFFFNDFPQFYFFRSGHNIGRPG